MFRASLRERKGRTLARLRTPLEGSPQTVGGAAFADVCFPVSKLSCHKEYTFWRAEVGKQSFKMEILGKTAAPTEENPFCYA